VWKQQKMGQNVMKNKYDGFNNSRLKGGKGKSEKFQNFTTQL
jgi:hypothetical protein